MGNPPYKAPAHNASAFNCPHCHAFSSQSWGSGVMIVNSKGVNLDKWEFAKCTHCLRFTCWLDKVLVYPDQGMAPAPNPDLPEDIKRDYLEASSIISKSPRGAAALLRLCIQKLCIHLGQKGKNINEDIKELVKVGLNANIKKGLDIVRVIGNEAVHPGTLDIKDNPEIAFALCNIINIISDSMITQPKVIDDLYQSLPAGALSQIEKRDEQ